MYEELINTTNGDFTVLSVERGAFNAKFPNWHCICKCNVCGRVKPIRVWHFTKGLCVSHKFCNTNRTPKISTVTSEKTTKRFYDIYQSMKARTEDPSNIHYNSYGGRGIDSNFWNSFLEFEDSMFESYQTACLTIPETDVTLERIDVNGPYCKENCCWVDKREQYSNLQSTIRFELISPDNKRYISDNVNGFAKTHNLNVHSLRSLLSGQNKQYKGWTGRRLSLEEFNSIRRLHVTDSDISFLLDSLYEIAIYRYQHYPWSFSNNSTSIPICALTNRTNYLITDEVICDICSMSKYSKVTVCVDNSKTYSALLVSIKEG